MNELINQLVDAIKEDSTYKDYIKKNALLNEEDIHQLLVTYSSLINEYNDLKKYDAYIDNKTLKDKIKSLKQQLANHQIIQNYYNSYYQLNSLLDEVTKIVFKDIDESLINNQWFK